MHADTPQARQQAHDSIEQPGPDQVAAVVQLLEVMVDPEDETLSEEDRRTVAASTEHFSQNPEPGVSFEQFAAECGFTMEQVLGHKG